MSIEISGRRRIEELIISKVTCLEMIIDKSVYLQF
jgi:hypothetical protein